MKLSTLPTANFVSQASATRQTFLRRVSCSAVQQAPPKNHVQQHIAVEECSTSESTRDRTLLILREASQQQKQQHGALKRQRSLESPTVYVSLDITVLCGHKSDPTFKALRRALLDLKSCGMTGVALDIWWSLVEPSPGTYDWSAYRQLLSVIVEVGLKIKAEFCFHGARQHGITLPSWVLSEAQLNPDVLYSDRLGVRCTECLSLGVDDVAAVAGRSGAQIYYGVMSSFRREFADLVEDGTVVAYTIGAGPDGEVRYPSHPVVEPRWSHRGVGEFQCYDRYMLANLMACAQRVGQPSWGLAGPHDAGACSWAPHDCQFFHHRFGSWESQYGRFFLQWYASKLVRHADRLLKAGAQAFREGSSVGTSVVPRAELRVPSVHWWYDTASHAAELTAGYHNTSPRDRYLPLFGVLARHGAGAQLMGCEARACEQLQAVLSAPERLLTQQRTVASALHVPVVLRNQAVRFDDAALQRVEAALVETSCLHGVCSLPVESLTYSSLGPAMLDENVWPRFRTFVSRVRKDALDEQLQQQQQQQQQQHHETTDRTALTTVNAGAAAAAVTGNCQLVHGQTFGPISLA